MMQNKELPGRIFLAGQLFIDIFAVAKSIYPLCGFDILLRNSI